MHRISRFGNFRILKIVTGDVSHVLDFFMQNSQKEENLFVFFHMDIPLEDHEELFQDYIQTLNDFLERYCPNCFEVTGSSYLSFPKELQIRYNVRYLH